jgi:hypothetical protein
VDGAGGVYVANTDGKDGGDNLVVQLPAGWRITMHLPGRMAERVLSATRRASRRMRMRRCVFDPRRTFAAI